MKTLPTGTVAISNSEIGAWQKCQTAWLYGYHPQANIRLKEAYSGPARHRGILAHKGWEIFFQAVMDGVDYDDAVTMVDEMIWETRRRAMENHDGDKQEMCRKLQVMFKRYFNHYREDVENWEFLGTERFHIMSAEPGDRFYIAMRIDQIIGFRSGKFKGEIAPLDHKTSNDWWSAVMYVLNGQMPNYIRALRQKKNFPREWRDAPIRRAVMNMVRTRDVKDPTDWELFKREFVVPPTIRVENVYQNFLKVARKIEPLKRMPFQEAREIVEMHLGPTSCRYCDFKNICVQMIDGRDPSSIIAVEFEDQDDYGYPELESFDVGIG